MTTSNPAITASCPDCEYEFSFDTVPDHGDRLTCPECWADLRVVSIDPLKLEWTTEVEEIWDDDREMEKES